MKYNAGLLQVVAQSLEQAHVVSTELEPPSIYLHPGQIFVTTTPATVTTILGSCVSVCLWDPLLNIGGINHYLLPTGIAAGAGGTRYGNIAIPALLEKLKRSGAQVKHLKAKLFGGACVLAAMRANGNAHLGIKNVEIAKQSLSDLGIPIVTSDVVGDRGRKLIFYPHDGSAFVRHL
jgi:chemotaxis protein CheD